ncbi:hypothetical protein P5F77_06270 [Caldifermentibacillus hisashii]|uniref:hypothetical protein n=1 Tax=Caldifermentibacillus hisashii TaxID=996558 RepID=UPI0030D66814
MTTRPILVNILRRKMLVFGDETHSRHHFELKYSTFSDETTFMLSVICQLH